MRKILIALAVALLAGCATGYGYSDYDGYGYGDYYYGRPSSRGYDYYGMPYGYGYGGLGYGRGYYGSPYRGWGGGWPWYGGYGSWYGWPGYYSSPGYYRPPHRPPVDNQPPPEQRPHPNPRVRSREELLRGRLLERPATGPGSNRVRDPAQLRRPAVPPPQAGIAPAPALQRAAPPVNRLRRADELRQRPPRTADVTPRPSAPATRVAEPRPAAAVQRPAPVRRARLPDPRTREQED